MKKLYFLFFYSFCFFASAQIITIPDANFKNKLITYGATKDSNGSTFNLDTNGNGEIEISEALNVYEIDVNGLSGLNLISNTAGLEYFTNVTKLNISKNVLTSLDLSALINLKVLDCSLNAITALSVNHLINLENLKCDNNQLSSINVVGLSNLVSLTCGLNSILDLNISNLPNLVEINCSAFGYNILNGYQKLTLSNLPNLTSLNSNIGGLTRGLSELNMSGLDNLQNIDCKLTALTTIDVTMLPNLQTLNVVNCYNLVSIFAKNGSDEMISIGSNLSTDNLKYICVDESQLSDIQYQISINSYITNCAVNTYCSFVPGGNYFNVEGQNRIDLDEDGCTASDSPYPFLKFSVNDGNSVEYFISGANQNYSTQLLAGTYTIMPILENPAYFTASPSSINVSFPQQNSAVVQDFCFTITPHHDVEIILYPTGPAVPGFDAKYRLIYRNKGNQTENGSVSLAFNNSILDFISANPVNDSSTINSFTWNYSNLQPFETRTIDIVLKLNSPMEIPAVNIDDILNYTATIVTELTDETPNDNTFTLNQTVVGSYDPNDKTCLEGATIAPSEVGEYVHYVIRFENTGTYQAQNIVVKDMIDLSKFDISTLVPLNGSHDYYTRIKNNKVEFIFENINLDFNDATNDGYVAFKIKTLPSLVLGDAFTNNASIYFDYNFPIITNTYTTTIAALNNQAFEFNSQFIMFPNPAKDVLNIQSKLGLALKSIEVYNQLGQIVLAVTNEVSAVDVSILASGTYFLKINTEKGSANAKFVKE